MIKKTFKYILLITTSIFFTGCSDLDVENFNDPDKDIVLSTSDGLRSLASGLFNTWYFQNQYNIGSPGPAMWVMADWGTVTFANYATLDMATEPRIAFNNSTSYGYNATTENYWRYMYNVITTANDVLTGINNGVEIGTDGEETSMVKGYAHFMQGLGNGSIGLVYDQGYASDENTDYEILEATNYQTSIDLAISQLEKAIEVFDNNEFTIPEGWMNGNTFTNLEMSQLAHSFIARLLVYAPRNTTQTDNLDWENVLHHAELGITSDFNIEGDGNGTDSQWMSWYKYSMARDQWGKVDMRVLHMLDENIPANWPESATSYTDLPNDGIITSDDLRVGTDFIYSTYNIRPERGIYRWSTYRYARLDDWIDANFYAPIIMMRKAEIDLFKAEALLRLDRLEEAANIINAGTRVTRGGLLPVAIDDETEIKDAIVYERTIELPLTGMGIEYFDMRREGKLQDGSLLHFPIPAQQLEVLVLPTYTFGGIAPQFGTPNEDVAVDGWYAAE